jgi:TPP-dependent 2-oxoacid decarboxylase
MFDLNAVNRRYFSIKLNDLELEVEPPKLKALKKITSLSKSRNEDAMDDLVEAICMLLSKNKNKYIVSEDIVGDLDLDQMTAILTAFFGWLDKEKNSPN